MKLETRHIQPETVKSKDTLRGKWYMKKTSQPGNLYQRSATFTDIQPNMQFYIWYDRDLTAPDIVCFDDDDEMIAVENMEIFVSFTYQDTD
jgi:hypothetical protein